MGIVTISLPESLKSFVEQQRLVRGFGTASDYVRELIQNEWDRKHLRRQLLEGAASAPGASTDGAFFDELPERARRRAAE